MQIPTDIAWQRTIDRRTRLVREARWYRLQVRAGATHPAHLIRGRR
ncbi:MAG: hypothetical protein AB7L17_07235 [Ilumatobacteraceae bacterium]